jgi:hypothetical protein
MTGCREVNHIKKVTAVSHQTVYRLMAEKAKLESLVQIAFTLSSKRTKFMELADQVRHIVGPDNSYPGLIGNLPNQLLQAIASHRIDPHTL